LEASAPAPDTQSEKASSSFGSLYAANVPGVDATQKRKSAQTTLPAFFRSGSGGVAADEPERSEARSKITIDQKMRTQEKARSNQRWKSLVNLHQQRKRG